MLTLRPPVECRPTGVGFDGVHDGRSDVFLGEFDASRSSLATP